MGIKLKMIFNFLLIYYNNHTYSDGDIMLKEYFVGLPHPLIITIVIIAIFAIVVIAIKGKFSAKFGDKTISIGGGKEDYNNKVPPPTVTFPQKRSCGDCILVLMGEREKLEFKVRKKVNKIMKTQMTFVEQKLIEIQTTLLDAISKRINKESPIDDSVQYKLIYGLLKDSLHKIKDEIRRSFKDNGFWDMDVSDFSHYLKDRTQVLNSMFITYVRNMYPNRGGVLETDVIIEVIETKSTFLTGLIHDLYMYSRDVKIETDKEVDEAQRVFTEWVDKFIN